MSQKKAVQNEEVKSATITLSVDAQVAGSLFDELPAEKIIRPKMAYALRCPMA